MELFIDCDNDFWRRVIRPGPKRLRFGASDAGVMLGLDKYKLPASLYDYRMELISNGFILSEEDKDDSSYKYKIHGHKGEPIVCNKYSQMTGYQIKKGNYWIHKKYPFYFGASPDRRCFINEELVGIMEAKVYCHILPDKIPPAHLAQVMFQLWVTELDWCDYMGCFIDINNPESCENPEFLSYRITPDQNYINWMERRLLRFVKCCEQKKRPTFGLAIDEKDLPPDIKLVPLTEYFYSTMDIDA